MGVRCLFVVADQYLSWLGLLPSDEAANLKCERPPVYTLAEI